MPLWGPPGHLVGRWLGGQSGQDDPPDGADVPAGAEFHAFSYSYAPFSLEGLTLQPVETRDGILVLRQVKDQVYLHGFRSRRGGYNSISPLLLLYRLPLQPGDRWEIPAHSLVSEQVVVVEGYETISTPRGPAESVVLAIYEPPLPTLNWAPGPGRSGGRWAGSRMAM